MKPNTKDRFILPVIKILAHQWKNINMRFLKNVRIREQTAWQSIYIKLNVCLYILYANLQFYSDLDEILYT
jgi:hypothetical protein